MNSTIAITPEARAEMLAALYVGQAAALLEELKDQEARAHADPAELAARLRDTAQRCVDLAKTAFKLAEVI